jgi:hypothetical protein
MMAGAGGKLDVSQAMQLPTQGLAAHRNTEFLPRPLRKIGQSPANHPVDRWYRAALDDRRKRLSLIVIETRGRARWLSVLKAIGRVGVEPQYPVPDDLKPDAADACRVSPCATIIDLSQSQ